MTLLLVLRPSKSGQTVPVTPLPHGGMVPGWPPPLGKKGKTYPKTSIQAFFADYRRHSGKSEIKLVRIETLKKESPMQFLKKLFGKDFNWLLDKYGKTFLLKIRRILLAILADDEKDND